MDSGVRVLRHDPHWQSQLLSWCGSYSVHWVSSSNLRLVGLSLMLSPVRVERPSGADLRLPPDASVSAGVYLLPHLATRERVYSFPSPLVCSPTLLAYQPQTSYSSFIVVEPRDRIEVDVDPAKYGYHVQLKGDVEVWEKTTSSDYQQMVQCSGSPQEARVGTFARVEREARK